MKSHITNIAVLLVLAVAPWARAEAPSSTKLYTKEQIDDAIKKGVAFLVKDQSPDGSWGTGRETRGNEVYSMVPGSLDAFRVGASALCVMALREVGEKTAHDKGLEFLLTVRDPKRDDGDLLYNTWAYIYSLQALVEEMKTNSDPRIRKVAERQIQEMVTFATYTGGWNYYDFREHTQPAAMGPTSFGTAAGLVSLWEAKHAGVPVPEKLVRSSMHRLEECRLPNGMYLYGSDYKFVPRLPANKVQGAVGRTQPANYALKLWGWEKLDKKDLRDGLDLFFKEHKYLDMGRGRPIPHESWYQTSGYYYYFDHYYASRLFEMLDARDKQKYATPLIDCVLPHQEPDGSWWDYAMWDFHKPYGTAFAIMTLLRCE